jgi:dTMP kinase
MPKGKLIVFEGADNLGKTTQIEALYSYLANEKKLNVIKTREPGATNLGSKIREILLNSKEKIPAKAQLLLFQADRNMHYETILKPYLDKGYTILCDRFYLSTLVYQHKLNGVSENSVYDLSGFSTNHLVPDKVFVFHGTMLTDEARDEYEKHTVNKNHEKLNNYYIEYGTVLPNHILINANRSKEVIFEELLAHIEEWI